MPCDVRREAFGELEQHRIAASRRICPFGRRDQHPHHRLPHPAQRKAGSRPHDERDAGERKQRNAEIKRTQRRRQETAALRLGARFGSAEPISIRSGQKETSSTTPMKRSTQPKAMRPASRSKPTLTAPMWARGMASK